MWRRCPRRCNSCNEGCDESCCRRSCCNRSCSVVFPGEFKNFSEMIPPSFLQTQPKPRKKKRREKPKGSTQAADCCKGNGPCEPECPGGREELGCVGQPAVTGCPGKPPSVKGVAGEPTDMPLYGPNGPAANPMGFGMPSSQYRCFEVPCTVCLPMDPSGCQEFNRGLPAAQRELPAAGLPTKRVPPFNPCTGQYLQYENSNEAYQNPTYEQFCQGLTMCFCPPNPYYLQNTGDETVVLPPGNISPVPQVNPSAGQGYQNTDRSMHNMTNQQHQYNPYNFGQGANAVYPNQQHQYNPGTNRGQTSNGPTDNIHNGGDGTVGCLSGNPGGVRQAKSSASEVSRARKRSKDQREEKESRGRSASKASESRKGERAGSNGVNRCGVPQAKPSKRGVSSDDKRSKGQRKETETRERSVSKASESRKGERANSNKAKRVEINMDPKRISQNIQFSGHVSQRSKSQSKENEGSQDRRSNFNRRNTPYVREMPRDSRKVNRSNSADNQVSQGTTNRLTSSGKRNESRRENVAKKSDQFKQTQTVDFNPKGTINPDQDHRGDTKSHSKKRKENPSKNQAECNSPFYQQSVSMSLGPSNLHYVADYPLPEPIYVSQLDSTLNETLPGNGRTSSPVRGRNESNGVTKTRRSMSSTKEGCKEQQNRCNTLRFNPNIECFYPPFPESVGSPQLLNRISEPLDDLQNWSPLLMPPTKKRVVSAAKKSKKVNSKATIKKTTMSKRSSANASVEHSPTGTRTPSDDDTVTSEKNSEESDSYESEHSDTQAGCVDSCPQATCCRLPKEPKSPPAEYTNSCWMPCPSPWPCCCRPYNGCYYCCGNYCNGCRNCCNYRCSPCGCYCCSRQSPSAQKPKARRSDGGVDKRYLKRYPGGTAASSSSYFPPLSMISCPIPRPSTMPGYCSTGPPNLNSPYSGRWRAGEVLYKPRSLRQNATCSLH